jgi:hypothetical protein
VDVRHLAALATGMGVADQDPVVHEVARTGDQQMGNQAILVVRRDA